MKSTVLACAIAVVAVVVIGLMSPLASAEDHAPKTIALIAGPPSHGYGGHEHNAGMLLLGKALNESGLPIAATVYQNGWPEDPSVLDDVDAIAVFCDGGGRHIMIPHLDQVDRLMKKGVGLACMHYGVEAPIGPAGEAIKNYTGGYFEVFWSVNPHWVADFKTLPDHQVANGVKPFRINDEWYYHMRFVDDMKGVTPILSAIPPESTLSRPDGPHSNNEHVRKTAGQPQHLLWVIDREDGGRGMGFTGGHWHWSWGDDNFRTSILNGLVWITGLDVPKGGVPSKTPTLEELKANQDYPPRGEMTEEQIKQILYPPEK